LEVKVLGTGCARCRKLYDEAQAALVQSGVAATLTKVETLDEILTYRVLMTPALVVAGEVKAAGRIPSQAEMVTWFVDAAAGE
jgi:small redox-active disulfide protein 2